VRLLRWTRRAREDLTSIRAYISEHSPNYAALVIGRIVAATDRVAQFPESGRAVPEFAQPGADGSRGRAEGAEARAGAQAGKLAWSERASLAFAAARDETRRA